MHFTLIKKLPSLQEILSTAPLSSAGEQSIRQHRQEVKNILQGRDKRLLMIVGPCSAWPKEAVLEYARRLSALNPHVQHALKLVMRVYIQKPRTTKGWMGPINQPDPLSHPDIEQGIFYTRTMMLKIIEMGLPIADEALFTNNDQGFLELLSWVAIGARSSEDQEHRIFASAMEAAVGLKNPTQGSLAVGVNSVVAAQHGHVTVFDGFEVKTSGNLYAHLVLRGSTQGPNYSLEHIAEVKRHMEFHKVQNPAIIIDVSHDNCLVQGEKAYDQQAQIVRNIINNLKKQPHLKTLVKGFMLESFLKPGNQKITTNPPANIDLSGLSITDPCLGWEDTQQLLLDLAA